MPTGKDSRVADAEGSLGLAIRMGANFCRRGLDEGWLCSADKDDAIQEACLALMQAARHYRPERGDFLPYATAAIRNQLRLWLHRRALVPPPRNRRDERPRSCVSIRRVEIIDQRQGDGAEGWFIQDLRAALARLPPAAAEALAARFGLEGGRPVGPADEAKRLGISKQAVWKRCQRALDALRNELGESYRAE